jgi:ATP-dependent Lhr-like helicase
LAYLAEGRAALGALPTQDTLVLERFFDESGGMQLVLHAPFGSRINKAWGLALRKRFCRQFNFELQAAATEEGLLLSLGPQHSFPLADVFRYLHPATARDVLVQAFLDAPVFQTRWRWNTTIALAVPRNRHGKKVAPQLQRMLADDLMAAAFPDAAACLENIPGDREVPDHPLVTQAVHDCLQEAMDFDGLARVLERIHHGEIACVARDTTEPSPLCHELLNARPYAFLDDAPLEERRAHAVYARRVGEPGRSDLGALDAAAIVRVLDEARPDPRDADELHDVLLTSGFLTAGEAEPIGGTLFQQLIQARRIAEVAIDGARIFVAVERLPEVASVAGPELTSAGPGLGPVNVHVHDVHDLTPPARRRQWTREDAVVELLRGRVSLVGPTTAEELGGPLRVDESQALAALETLEARGVVLRGTFRHGHRGLEWCERGLLARIHRYTLNRLRAEIEPVPPATYMRFLFDWQHAAPGSRLSGLDGLGQIVRTLDGFELPAAAWEASVLPARMDKYDSAWLDMLCLTGQVGWARVTRPTTPTRVVRTTAIALFAQEQGSTWLALASASGRDDALPVLSTEARTTLETLVARGALFAHEIEATCTFAAETLRQALAELVSAGLVASDGFSGLRGVIGDHRERRAMSGRWYASRSTDRPTAAGPTTGSPDGVRQRGGGQPAQRTDDDLVEIQARVLLRRYGIVCRRVLAREPNPQPWRVLARIYRTLEARGEIRGGRFVSGLAGEQFALPEAVERLREVRRTPTDDQVLVISAADPLNLAGLVTAGDRVAALASTRMAYRNGVPLAVLEGDYIRPIAEVDPAIAADVASALTGRRMPPVVSGFVGRAV